MSTNDSPRARWIDVHHHILPPAYLAALERAGITDPIPGVDWPTWDREADLAMMDRQEIATAIVSVSDPGILFGDLAPARTLARTINEFMADLVAEHPQRFGAFAVLPLPDVEAALQEVAYALDTLKFDGIRPLDPLSRDLPGRGDLGAPARRATPATDRRVGPSGDSAKQRSTHVWAAAIPLRVPL